MYVGYGIVTKDQFERMYDTLSDFGCRHIFIDDLDVNRKFGSGFQKALSKLNPNDILIIEQIEHLSHSDSVLLDHLHTLVKKKIHLRVLADNRFLCWDTSSHLTLLLLLKKFQQQKKQAQNQARQETLSKKNKQAGANSKINPKKRKLINSLLATNQYTVTEICQEAGICKATFYNHFGSKKEALKQLQLLPSC